MSQQELYTGPLINILEKIWGEGFLSPGGEAEVRRLVGSHDFAGRSVLDIGCGAGGIDLTLVRSHGAGHVTGIDVEDGVIARASELVAIAGLKDRIGFGKVSPGPLPFPPGTFDIVFSKDSIIHIPDKHALAAEAFRVLKPGGWFVASDWLIGHDGTPSPQMTEYIRSEGLDFGMASPGRYHAALADAGFADIRVESRNAWYREEARRELERMKGPWRQDAEAEFGADFVAHDIEIWERMIPVLETGEHCPTHLHARKPVWYRGRFSR